VIIKVFLAILLGFSSGVVISGAVFAFISVIGVVPRLAQKTKTVRFIPLYEEAMILGGILGCAAGFFNITLPLPRIFVVILGFCAGVFYGCLAVSLAEVINVIPILTRRTKLGKGMFFFILAIALGKLMGSVIYYIIPDFYKTG